MKLLQRFPVLFILSSMLLSPVVSPSQTKSQPTKPRVKSLRGPSVEEALVERLKTQPDLSTEELVTLGNTLIATHGFEFSFENCSVVGRVSAKEKESPYTLHPRRATFVGLNGKRTLFEVNVSDPDDVVRFTAPCT